MANRTIQLPIKGVSEGFPIESSPPLTSGHMNNVIPRDVLEQRIRLSQRPGLDKVFTQQIGGTTAPIIAMIQVSSMD